MPDFLRAREALALRLRELRRDGRLTRRQLAAEHGWHPSKVSKYIEFRRMFRAGQRSMQEDIAETASETEFLRNFENVFACGRSVMATGLRSRPGQRARRAT